MTVTFTPSWTDTGTEVIAPQALARGSSARGTLNLLTKHGAYVFIGLGRGGTTALTNGVTVEIRRTCNAGAILMPGAPWFSALSTTTASIVKLINLLAGYAAGTSAFEVDGTGTPAADEDYCFWGVDAIPAGGTALSTLEFLRVSKFSGTTLTVDAPSKQAHADNEIITNRADQWCVWCAGGCTYEVIIDYGDDAAGEAVAVVCYAQTLASEQGA